MEKICQASLNWLNVGGISILVPVFIAIQQTYELMSADAMKRSSKEITTFLRQSQRAVFELRKCDAFWAVFKAFVEMMYNPNLLGLKEFEEVLLEISSAILEESNLVHGMSFVVVNRVNVDFDASLIMILGFSVWS